MAFTYFSKLPQELRQQIWAEAAVFRCQQYLRSTRYPIVDEPCPTSKAERQRQALIGYSSIPTDSPELEQQRRPLRLYVYVSNETDELQIGENEFHTLVNRFSMATACVEARAHVTKFCRARIEFVTLFPVIDRQLPEDRPILQQPVLTDMPTVMVTTSTYHPDEGTEAKFESPEQLVDVIARVFGNGIKRLIWNAWGQPVIGMSGFYWPHTSLLEHLPESAYDLIEDSSHTEPAHFMSSDLILHIQKELYESEIPEGSSYYDRRLILRQALKHSEFWRAATKTLPQLQFFEVELRTTSWAEIVTTRLETTYKDGTVWIGKNNLPVSEDIRMDYGWNSM
ncbi:unnamed protein product [Periconia digitata]|uniref:2EXR domain-containing protein n=1 Tax=Periconia digitata TaxID=1303443 RepID=A0A9W4XJX5_9PLEO|nr:unnamed protein product [Periconia digitata]